MSRGAIAIFVKTPGLSPVKTRLAAKISAKAAEEFYSLSVKAVRSACLLAKATLPEHNVEIFWAVAEPPAPQHHMWEDLPTVNQGTGSLGNRLNKVYASLIQDHDWVICLGGDAPLVSAEYVASAVHAAGNAKNVIGPAVDGGYVLFLGTKPIPEKLWLDVPYSSHNTSARFKALLEEIFGRVHMLSSLSDVDEYEDLLALKEELRRSPRGKKELDDIFEWLCR
ncbi:MAG: DUF2064 domain-containing protein [Oligoflexales bacterium]